MRTREEIEKRIEDIEHYINVNRIKSAMYVHQLRQEVCALKWVLEPAGYDSSKEILS